MDKIRVIHIVQAEGAGVTEYIKMLATQMKLDKYEIIVLGSLYYEMERDYFEAKGWRLYTLPMRREIDPIKDMQAMLKVRRYLKQLQPHIIHIHSSKAGIIGRLAAVGLKTGIIYNAHGWAFNMKVSARKICLYQMVEKYLSNLTHKIINISDDEYESAKQAGLPEDKMLTIKNAIDTHKHNTYFKSDILKQLDIPLDAYIIGICGRITEQKAPHIFIEICSRIIQQIPNAYFLMIGDGELREEVMQGAFEKGISHRFMITGWTKEPEKYISILDIALLTSRWEGFGLVLLQYIAYRKPIIAAKVGGIPEIVRDGVTGQLVEWDDIEGYCNKIMSYYMSPSMYQHLIEKAYQMLQEEYSLERLVLSHESLYLSVMQNTKSGKK